MEQVLLIEDNDAPFWLEEPAEQIFTDNIDGEVFDTPVADDVCSNFEVDMTTSYMRGFVPSVCRVDTAPLSPPTSAATHRLPSSRSSRRKRT